MSAADYTDMIRMLDGYGRVVEVRLLRSPHDGAVVVQIDTSGEPNDMAKDDQLRIYINDGGLWPDVEDLSMFPGPARDKGVGR